jgi:hypothetical protein
MIRKKGVLKRGRVSRKLSLIKKTRPPHQNLLQKAYMKGEYYGRAYRNNEAEESHQEINKLWAGWYQRQRSKHTSWRQYDAYAEAFLHGFYRESGIQERNWILLPTQKTTAAILSVKNEEKTIKDVLHQLDRLPLAERIVVVSGSDDGSLDVIKKHHTRPIIIHYEAELGYDVGRAIGAKAANSEILLFLGGDVKVSAKNLVPFIAAIEQGNDIAVNNISPFVRLYGNRDSVSMVKEFVNRAFGKPKLAANSLTTVPYAMSQKAAQVIGYSNLAVPPLAQAIAIHSHLKIAAPASVDVINKNKVRVSNTGLDKEVANMIIGDYVEALHLAMKQRGERLFFPDKMRKRHLARGGIR